MGHYEPHTVCQLADVIDDICSDLQGNGYPVARTMKLALAKRVFELFESGITDPDRLRMEVMTASPWESRGEQPSLLKRAYKLARYGGCKSVNEIGRQLKMEGYSPTSVDAQLNESSLSTELIKILSRAENT
jgi:hypothetical protein